MTTFAEGRFSGLFAMLAGVCLALLIGRQEPCAARQRWCAAARMVLGGLILVAFGTILTVLDVSVVNILAYYGVYVLLALPLLRLRSQALTIVAAVLAVAGPIVSFLLRRWDPAIGWSGTINHYVPLAAISGDDLAQLIVAGAYPATTWIPFMVTGMALGRLDLDGTGNFP